MPLMQPNINVLLEIAADEIVVVFSLSVLMLERNVFGKNVGGQHERCVSVLIQLDKLYAIEDKGFSAAYLCEFHIFDHFASPFKYHLHCGVSCAQHQSRLGSEHEAYQCSSERSFPDHTR